MALVNPPTPLPARGRRWGSVRLALERDCGSLLPSLSPSPVQPCTLPAFFLSLVSCSSSFLFFPFPFCCRRTPLVGARCRQTRPGKAREAKLLWLAAPSGPIALLHIGLKCDVRHSAAAEQAAGALLWFVLAAAKRVRPPSALDAKLFLLVAPWGPIAVYFLYSTPLVGARCGQTSAAWKSAENKQTSKQASKQASQQA